MAFPPARSISLTTDAAASAPFVYVTAMFARAAARRSAMAAPIPREPPVMSATFPSNFLDIAHVLLVEPDGGWQPWNQMLQLGQRLRPEARSNVIDISTEWWGRRNSNSRALS